jgi:hypothetical protein
MLKTELAASSNYTERIIVKNLTSNTTGVLTGYKILVTENPNDYNFLNTKIDFDTEVTVLPGNKQNFEVVCFPSRKFELLLYTNHNTSDKITVNVNTYDPLSCAQYYSYLNPPTINVTEFTTSDTTPDLNGVISDTSATLSLILDGNTYTPDNGGDGTWSLTSVDELSNGSYDINICATDTYGLITCDDSENELTVQSSNLDMNLDYSMGNYEGFSNITADMSYTYDGNIFPITCEWKIDDIVKTTTCSEICLHTGFDYTCTYENKFYVSTGLHTVTLTVDDTVLTSSETENIPYMNHPMFD